MPAMPDSDPIDELVFVTDAHAAIVTNTPGAKVNGIVVALYSGSTGSAFVEVGSYFPSWARLSKQAQAPDVATARRWIVGWWRRDREQILRDLRVDWWAVKPADLQVAAGDWSKLPRLKDRLPAPVRKARRRR